MLSTTLLDALNEQMKNEFYSAYLYMAMSGYFQSEDLPGFASWMRIQAMEEMTHGEKFFNFICETGGKTNFLAIDAPPDQYESPLETIEHGLQHERFVTERIGVLMDTAIRERNHAAQIMLQCFVTEQVEEEANFSLLLRKLKRVEGDGRGPLLLDQELSQRVFVPPPAQA